MTGCPIIYLLHYVVILPQVIVTRFVISKLFRHCSIPVNMVYVLMTTVDLMLFAPIQKIALHQSK